jgi:membrane-bound lytic murein transglycosylase A
MKSKKTTYSLIISVLVLIIAAILFWIFWLSKPAPLSYRIIAFKNLPGWSGTNVQQSLQAFQISCKAFLKMAPNEAVGSQVIHMTAKDWRPACLAALKIDIHSPNSAIQAKKFFETWFTPIVWFDNKPRYGLFTGYYLPFFPGNLSKTKEYSVPIYGLPSDLISIHLEDFDNNLPPRHLFGRVLNNQLLPYYTRAAINKGAIEDKAPILAWVKSHIDRLFLEIQGSGTIELPDGKLIYLNYAGENGRRYTPIGRILVEKGVMTKENASMQGIRAYLEAHPKAIIPIINKNQSFVFFRELSRPAALGAQGVGLTPGYSLAVDRKWIPLGAPLWLNTTRPSPKTKIPVPLQRLMIAQDTGGAIRGVVRGDVFWGGGDKATFIAGNMKNQGIYWLFLPKDMIKQLPLKFDEN